MSALTNPTANHASRVIEKHLIVQGKLTAKNIFTENEWKAYTPTIIGGGGTFATTATIFARWRLSGSTLEVSFSYTDTAATGAASTGTYIVSLPSGVILSLQRTALAVGTCFAVESAGSTTLMGTVAVSGTTSPGFQCYLATELVAPVPWGNAAPAGVRVTTATGKTITASFRVEIEPTSPLLLAQNN